MNAINFIDGLDGLVAGVALIANGVFFVYTYLLVQQTSPLNYFNLASLHRDRARRRVRRVPAAQLASGEALHGRRRAPCSSACSWPRPRSRSPARSTRPRSDSTSCSPRSSRSSCRSRCSSIPLLDFGLAVFRRLRAGKSPFSADRKHLHHRLLDMGHSHLHAVLIFYAWTAVASHRMPALVRVPRLPRHRLRLGVPAARDRLPRLHHRHARTARPPQALEVAAEAEPVDVPEARGDSTSSTPARRSPVEAPAARIGRPRTGAR